MSRGPTLEVVDAEVLAHLGAHPWPGNEVLAGLQRADLGPLLDHTAGIISEAARRSDMDRTYLAELARRLGLES